MKKLESTLPNMAIVLTAVTMISAALLGVMHSVTADPIAAIEKKTLEDGISKVLLAQGKQIDVQVEDLNVKGDDGKEHFFTVYTASENGAVIGKAVKTSVNGFSPDLTVLTGFDAEGNILGYEILKTAETPGLGAKANAWFQKESGEKRTIVGKNPGKNNLTVSKDGGEIDAITASTITSRAFLKAVNAEDHAVFTGNTDALSGATTKAAPASDAVPADSAAVTEVAAEAAPEAPCNAMTEPEK